MKVYEKHLESGSTVEPSPSDKTHILLGNDKKLDYSMPEMRLHRTRFPAQVVYSGMGTARAKAAVVVQHSPHQEDSIIFVGSQAEAQERYPDSPVEAEAFAISPPAINAFSCLEIPATVAVDLASYLKLYLEPSISPDNALQESYHQLQELNKYQQKTLISHCFHGSTIKYLLREDLSGVVYWHLPLPGKLSDADFLAQTIAELKSLKHAQENDGLILGLSLAFPYFYSAQLLKQLSELCRVNRLNLQIILPRHPDEISLACHLAREHSLKCDRPQNVVAWLKTLQVLSSHLTLIHASCLSEEEIALIQKSGARLVHCARANQALACPLPKFQNIQAKGLDIALGSDLWAFGSSLNVKDDVYALLEAEHLAAISLVRYAVKGGYQVMNAKVERLARGEKFSPFYIW